VLGCEARRHLPRVVHVDSDNRVVDLGTDPAVPVPGAADQLSGGLVETHRRAALPAGQAGSPAMAPMAPMDPARLGRITAEVSELGEYFHVFTTHDGPGRRWLREPLRDREALEARILATAGACRTTDTRDVVKVSPRLLWGNAASSLTGVIGVIAHERPSHASEAIALGDLLLGLGHLRGTGHQTEPVAGHPFFTRTTCCLNYRIPDAGHCDDCVLLAPETRQERWFEALRAGRQAPQAGCESPEPSSSPSPVAARDRTEGERPVTPPP
jgi:hypothetical protein